VPPVTTDCPDPYIKIHVDFLGEDVHLSYRELKRANNPDKRPGNYFFAPRPGGWPFLLPPRAPGVLCPARHPEGVCKCHLALYHIGQDEAIFKQNSLPAWNWTFQGKCKLRPKTDGQGIMVSAFWDEWRGIGFRMTPEELAKVNEWRAGEKKSRLQHSPGLIFFEYGKNKGGMWDGAKFQDQVEDLVDAFEVLYPGMQLLIEVDHSSGHLKTQSDGLHVANMNLYWGGKKPVLHDTVIEAGCLGADVPVVHGSKLTINSIQSMVFKPDDDPPHFLPSNATVPPQYDRPMNDEEMAIEDKRVKAAKKRAKKRPAAGRVEGQAGEGAEGQAGEDDEERRLIVVRYVGKPKGILQVRNFPLIYRAERHGANTLSTMYAGTL
jgi:hypothetical protein